MTGDFGRRLRRLRGDRSQREIANALGIPTTTLSSLEQQESVPRGPMLQRLSDHFGVPVNYFFPAERKASATAREWLKDIRQRSFDVAPTIATHAPPNFSEEDKKQFANYLKAKIAKSED